MTKLLLPFAAVVLTATSLMDETHGLIVKTNTTENGCRKLTWTFTPNRPPAADIDGAGAAEPSPPTSAPTQSADRRLVGVQVDVSAQLMCAVQLNANCGTCLGGVPLSTNNKFENLPKENKQCLAQCAANLKLTACEALFMDLLNAVNGEINRCKAVISTKCALCQSFTEPVERFFCEGKCFKENAAFFQTQKCLPQNITIGSGPVNGTTGSRCLDLVLNTCKECKPPADLSLPGNFTRDCLGSCYAANKMTFLRSLCIPKLPAKGFFDESRLTKFVFKLDKILAKKDIDATIKVNFVEGDAFKVVVETTFPVAQTLEVGEPTEPDPVTGASTISLSVGSVGSGSALMGNFASNNGALLTGAAACLTSQTNQQRLLAGLATGLAYATLADAQTTTCDAIIKVTITHRGFGPIVKNFAQAKEFLKDP